MTNPQTTLSVSIEADAQKVYAFASNGANLSLWASTFCLSVEPDGEDWRIETPQGTMTMRLAKPNIFGVLDHIVQPPDAEPIYVPMRVVPNGDGCDVLFTLFKLPSMSEERYEADLAFVRQDLQRLKTIMEKDG